MYMQEIYLSTSCQMISFDREIFKFCVRGDVNEVEKLLKQNENIYQPHKEVFSIVPLTVAIESKDEDLINLLLDVYERDLEALKGTNFKKALIALPEDQNEEFLQTIEDQPCSDSIPVLLKNDNQTIPKCVYLRKRLKHKDDLSLKLATTLEAKNGTCDLNYSKLYNSFCDSFLQIAIYYEIDEIVERLVNHPTVDIMTTNLMTNHTTLHYALHVGNMRNLKLLLSKFNFGNYWEDPQNIYYAMTSKKERSIKFITNKIFESGKT
ncbi:CLUMA_CG016774, isoform A [Clunio marinus]|uniref:CLUMA_CG016774, isoform A n=1 Tax=Clunio marinus TaxID=568069 RepID=A0A1J1IS30_9DIPT|nr:CLUMA_CG016774, isoform A [Clunio marinus]